METKETNKKKETDREAGRHADGRTDRRQDGWTDGRTGRPEDRQTSTQADKQTEQNKTVCGSCPLLDLRTDGESLHKTK